MDNVTGDAPLVVKKSRVSKRSSSWAEKETFTLLKAWGEKLQKHGKRGVTFEEWSEVAEKVSEVSKHSRTTTHCHNRMDSLKRSYKKEKAMLAENADYSSNWVYFTKMDKIVTLSLNGFDRSLDSNETNQIVNSEVHPDRANSSDEVRDSPPRKRRRVGKERGSGDAFKLLADLVNRFENVYEKVQSSKLEQLDELEKFRLDIKKEVEMEKEEILKKGKLEIAKILVAEIEDDDLSPAPSPRVT